jgi:hypothetical protein
LIEYPHLKPLYASLRLAYLTTSRFSKLGLFALAITSSYSYAWDTPTYGNTSIAMGDTLAFGGDDLNHDVPHMGNWHLNAALSGLAANQSNANLGDPRNYGDVSNAQAVVSKSTGLFQFFAVAGFYSIPDLSTNYTRAATQTKNTWGALPIAIATFAPDPNWSLNVGNLFALGGSEGTFTYENINIQRGLLWGQTNSVTRGAQLNYQNNAWSSSIAWTDGAYSGTYNWLGISTAYQLNSQSSVTAVWNGSLSGNAINTTGTPLLQNNSQITNLLYSYSANRWAINPYLQYSIVPARPSIGIAGVSGTQGFGLLTTYRITPLVDGQPAKKNMTVPFRLEYLNSWGNSGTSSNNLLYGPNSAAWSATITPTFQDGFLFARIEGSYVRANNYTNGTAFGVSGSAPAQARVMLEVGFLY